MPRVGGDGDGQGNGADLGHPTSYDPISAHFILTDDRDGNTVATVRLTPYPRTEAGNGQEQEGHPSSGEQDGSANKSDEAHGLESGLDAGQAADGFPLGAPLSESTLGQRFMRVLTSTAPFREIDGAPIARGAKLSRLAVCKSMRGKHLGALTMEAAEAWLLRVLRKEVGSSGEGVGALTIIISSQMHAKGFYERLGYAVYGEPYDEEGAPHTWCTKRLSL